ncbi:MAG: hypothetical protein ACTS7D_01410, partial [Candidatus Hodgkinia cicadicola]
TLFWQFRRPNRWPGRPDTNAQPVERNVRRRPLLRTHLKWRKPTATAVGLSSNLLRRLTANAFMDLSYFRRIACASFGRKGLCTSAMGTERNALR